MASFSLAPHYYNSSQADNVASIFHRMILQEVIYNLDFRLVVTVNGIADLWKTTATIVSGDWFKGLRPAGFRENPASILLPTCALLEKGNPGLRLNG